MAFIHMLKLELPELTMAQGGTFSLLISDRPNVLRIKDNFPLQIFVNLLPLVLKWLESFVLLLCANTLWDRTQKSNFLYLNAINYLFVTFVMLFWRFSLLDRDFFEGMN